MRAAILNKERKEWVQVIPVKAYYTVQEAGIILDVGPPSVYSALKRGTLGGVLINGVKHVPHDKLVEYIDRRGGGRQALDISSAVIEEIRPDEDSKRQAVDMVRAVNDVSKPEDRKSPLDFLDEE